jgi:hypothetical protein
MAHKLMQKLICQTLLEMKYTGSCDPQLILVAHKGSHRAFQRLWFQGAYFCGQQGLTCSPQRNIILQILRLSEIFNFSEFL